jgi:AcrR family transcriptional regulator
MNTPYGAVTPDKPDRRRERTRYMLQDALNELVQECDYAEITIQMIVDRANVARVTFYRHYRDKTELLMDYLNSVNAELTPFIKPVTPMTFPPSGSDIPNLRMYRHIADQRKLYKALMCGAAAAVVRQQIIANMMQYTSGNMALLLSHLDPHTQQIIAQCITNTSYGMIVWWLENDAPCTPDELAQMVVRHNAAGVMGFMHGN